MSTNTARIALIEGAIEQYDGEWAFDATYEDSTYADLDPYQYAAAVKVAQEPENADCERGDACVNQRPVLIVGGKVQKRSSSVIGFHLVEDSDTGYESMRFTPFFVTAAGAAICEGCGDAEQG